MIKPTEEIFAKMTKDFCLHHRQTTITVACIMYVPDIHITFLLPLKLLVASEGDNQQHNAKEVDITRH